MIFPNPFRFAWAMIVSAYGRLWGYQILADEDVAEDRLDICEECPFRRGEQCGICSCWLEAKVRLNLEQCPKKKWTRLWIKKRTI